jgi:hypothetical protein
MAKNINEKPLGISSVSCNCSGNNITNIENKAIPSQWYNTYNDVRAITGYEKGDYIGCFENGYSYIFNEESLLNENTNPTGTSIIRPNDITSANPGRWVSVYTNQEFATDEMMVKDPMTDGLRIIDPVRLQLWVNDYFNAQEVVYFGKHGSDTIESFDGRTPNKAKLTITEAVMSDFNSIAVGTDGETYDESFSILNNGVYAPLAIVNKIDTGVFQFALNLAKSSFVQFNEINLEVNGTPSQAVTVQLQPNGWVYYINANKIKNSVTVSISQSGRIAVGWLGGAGGNSIAYVTSNEIIGDIRITLGNTMYVNCANITGTIYNYGTLYINCLEHTGSIFGDGTIIGMINGVKYPLNSPYYITGIEQGSIQTEPYLAPAIIPAATVTHAGLMTAQDRVILDSLAGSGGKTYKGVIDLPGDFPTLAEVESGWWYSIGTNVTDNDVTKTNTGDSFTAGQTIYWTELNTWAEFGLTDVDVSELTANNWKLFYSDSTGYVQELTLGNTGTVLRGNGENPPTFETLTNITDLLANSYKVFFSNGSGVITELSLGDSGKVLVSKGSNSLPEFNFIDLSDGTTYSVDNNALLVADANYKISHIAYGNTGLVLRGNGGSNPPSFGQIDLTEITFDNIFNSIVTVNDDTNLELVSYGAAGTVLTGNGATTAPSFKTLDAIEYQIFFPELENEIYITAPYGMSITSVTGVTVSTYEFNKNDAGYVVPSFPYTLVTNDVLAIKITAFAGAYTKGDLTIFATKS